MPIRDDFPHGFSGTDPSSEFFAIVPSDTVDLAARPRAIYVGTGGNVAIRALDGVTTVVFKGMVSGNVLPCRTTRVMATGTTATDLVALL